MYTFFDENNPTQVDLSFSVGTQLATSGQSEPLMTIGGLFASDFTGQSIRYLQGPPGFQPVLQSNGNPFISAIFSSFPFGNPSNGAPGDGTFPVSSSILEFVGTDLIDLADQGSVTISGVPSNTPLPAALPLFASGLGGLGFIGWHRKRKAKAA